MLTLHLHFKLFCILSTVLKVRITSSIKKGSQRVLKGRVQRVLQKGLVDLKKGDTVHLHSNSTCDCPQVKQLDAEYLVAGHEDVGRNKLYLLPKNGVVETWERAWVGKFRKWEKRLAGKRLGRKHNRKNRKRRRKGTIYFLCYYYIVNSRNVHF